MRQNVWLSLRAASRLFALSLVCVVALAASASAQGQRAAGNLVDIKVSDVTLEAVNFRDQTARMSVGLDISNGLVPVKLKDFDYRLRLFNEDFIDGRYDGTMKIGGKQASRVSLPVTLSLRSVPNIVWNAFSNRGQVSYQLDAGFTIPLFIFNKRVQANFDGEVPLRSLVDAATILRARNGGGSRVDSLGGILGGIW
ncbi:MAG TPA: LEA type 2 family protein [Pyrinomonadaceae bacterium]|nr:LEA type 2 family protein [Pyrinomonadaceae bacterium]